MAYSSSELATHLDEALLMELLSRYVVFSVTHFEAKTKYLMRKTRIY